MKYIIMCGGVYPKWQKPRQLLKINGEEIVARTIRLLRENGIEDIAISTLDPAFKKFGVPLLKHKNNYLARGYNDSDGFWPEAFYPTDEPVCYIFGDVIFSSEAIKTIVETETDSIEFFGSAPPFAENYYKTNEEPFAFKVVDLDLFWRSIEKTRELAPTAWRPPLSWELWSVIKGRNIDKQELVIDYTVINDYTCDIDNRYEIKHLRKYMNVKA